jgi:hypothetical protein
LRHPKSFENRGLVEDPAPGAAVDRQGHRAGALPGSQRGAAIAGEGENLGQMNPLSHGLLPLLWG